MFFIFNKEVKKSNYALGNVSIGSKSPFDTPLYFQLPPQFLGDKINTYGGFLKYSIQTEGCETVLSNNILEQYPLVRIHAHNDLIIDYFGVSKICFVHCVCNKCCCKLSPRYTMQLQTLLMKLV